MEKVRLHDAAWYAENRIELIAGNAATSIDAAAKTVGLADGQTIGFDKLMLTTGARVRRLPVPGADLDGVFYLRTIEDSEAIRRPIAAGTEVAVIGGGFIGLEIAGSAVKRGAEVTVLEAADRLMGRSVAPEVSDWFAGMHRDRGVDLRLGVSVAAIEGNGAATGVRLGDGSVVPATVVVIGIGILPNVEIAEAAGLAVDERHRRGRPRTDLAPGHLGRRRRRQPAQRLRRPAPAAGKLPERPGPGGSRGAQPVRRGRGL